MLAAAALALAWRVLAVASPGAATAPCRAWSRYPAAAFIAFACLSLAWADRLAPAAELLTYFTIPFALLLGRAWRGRRSPTGRRARWRRLGVGLGVLFAVVGLYQAATRELFFFAPNLAVSNNNSDFFRVTSLFGDPSLYGRHVVLAHGRPARGAGAAAGGRAAGRRRCWCVMWAGLFFSYSQSSMVALIAVTLAVAALTGDAAGAAGGGRRPGRGAAAGVGYVASIEIRGDSLRSETSDRTQRVEDTVRVVREDPLDGRRHRRPGLGQPPAAARSASRPTPNFVSHTTPLTVAAELGVVGLALYVWLIVGGVACDRRGAAARPRRSGWRSAPSLLGAVRARALLQRLPRGPAHLAGAGDRRGQLTWPRRDDGVHRGRRPTDASEA